MGHFLGCLDLKEAALGFFILLIEVPWFVVPDSGGVSSNHAMEEKKKKRIQLGIHATKCIQRECMYD